MNRKIKHRAEHLDSVSALIDQTVKRNAKKQAVEDDISLAQVIECLLTDYANQKIKANARNITSSGK